MRPPNFLPKQFPPNSNYLKHFHMEMSHLNLNANL